MRRPPAFNEAPLPLFKDEEAVKAVNSERLPSYIVGHRKRLRQRLLQRGEVALEDYELLELLLFRTFRRGDVKPLASRLLDRFGNVDRVMSASEHQLSDVDGVGPEVVLDLMTVGAMTKRMARSAVLEMPVLSGWGALLDYCHTTMAHGSTEQFRVLFLDRKNVLIKDEELAKGTVDHVPVYPREVVGRALELRASALILVHNHPSGDPTPSEADIAMTLKIQDGLNFMDLTLHDHIIIGKETELSMRSAGYL